MVERPVPWSQINGGLAYWGLNTLNRDRVCLKTRYPRYVVPIRFKPNFFLFGGLKYRARADNSSLCLVPLVNGTIFQPKDTKPFSTHCLSYSLHE